jgi:hypothetical protein
MIEAVRFVNNNYYRLHQNVPQRKVRIKMYATRMVNAADMVFESATPKTEAIPGQSKRRINTTKIGGINSMPVSATYHALA